MAVISTGRNRTLPAVSAAPMLSLPASICWLAKVTIRMEFAVATAPGSLLEPQHLPRPRPEAAVAPVPAAQPPRSPDAFTPLAIEVRDLERRRIKEALAAANGVQTRAAELLSMPRRTFVLRLRELRLTGEPV